MILFICEKIYNMTRVCKMCGIAISGRKDKKFCGYNCKSNYNNAIYKESSKEFKNNPIILKIEKNIKDLEINSNHKLIKLILLFTFICKIFSNFEVNKKWQNGKNKVYSNCVSDNSD